MPPRNGSRPVLRRGVLAGLIGLASVTPVTAAPLRLPPLLDPAVPDHHPGKVIFVELVTPDLAAARRFYGGLFGWTFRDVPGDGPGYAEAWLGGRPVAGLVNRPVAAGEHRQPAWLSFIAAGDVDATTHTALQNGAKLLSAPRDVPDIGRRSVLSDPQGAVFAVLGSSSGDPPDVLAAPGEWIWSSLITRDPDTGAAFYQTLFGYEVFELPADQGAEHLLLASDGYARASVNPLPADQPGVHPHWLDFIRVDDAVKVAAQAVALGGRMLVGPRLDRHGGKVAVVADPAGAPFGLLEWPDTESREMPK